MMDFIRTRLTEVLAPTFLEVIDESQHHLGHRGNQGGGHFCVRISSPQFRDKKLLECHRLIYQALGEVVGKEIHALRIEVVN